MGQTSPQMVANDQGRLEVWPRGVTPRENSSRTTVQALIRSIGKASEIQCRSGSDCHWPSGSKSQTSPFRLKLPTSPRRLNSSEATSGRQAGFVGQASPFIWSSKVTSSGGV